ncbi:IS3 family transposase [Streptomyces sp. NPDC058092]|uniref:IS3 family transposase n=1 Tax=Streptomyces sp. NPDC058092 TaxID=3346336 RepID=UPI0036E4E629
MAGRPPKAKRRAAGHRESVRGRPTRRLGARYCAGACPKPWACADESSPRGPRRTSPLFEYIDGFYNGRRIQERLGWLSPIEFEEKHYANPAASERTNLKPRQPDLTS